MKKPENESKDFFEIRPIELTTQQRKFLSLKAHRNKLLKNKRSKFQSLGYFKEVAKIQKELTISAKIITDYLDHHNMFLVYKKAAIMLIQDSNKTEPELLAYLEKGDSPFMEDFYKIIHTRYAIENNTRKYYSRKYY